MLTEPVESYHYFVCRVFLPTKKRQSVKVFSIRQQRQEHRKAYTQTSVSSLEVFTFLGKVNLTSIPRHARIRSFNFVHHNDRQCLNETGKAKLMRHRAWTSESNLMACWVHCTMIKMVPLFTNHDRLKFYQLWGLSRYKPAVLHGIWQLAAEIMSTLHTTQCCPWDKYLFIRYLFLGFYRVFAFFDFTRSNIEYFR